MFTQTSMGTPDLLARLKAPGSAELFRAAHDQNRSLTMLLEQLSPTDPADRTGLDAFGRCMREADVIVQSIPEEGVYADTYETFLERAGRTLFAEFAWRKHRRAKGAFGASRAPLLSGDTIAGSPLRPYVDNLSVVRDDFQPAIPVSEVLAGERGIQGNLFRGIYLNEPVAASKRFVRIGEAAEIPKVTISLGQKQIDMYKFGRGIELSYEVMRRESMDRLGTIIQEMSVQSEIDKLSVIVDVMVVGDGNANTAATSFNLTTLDAGTTANVITPTAWYAFRSKWLNPYQMTHVLVRAATAVPLMVMNTGSANLPLSLWSGVGLAPAFAPINRNLSQTIRIGETDDAPSAKWLGFDKRFAVERVFEIGSEIQETENYASNQTQALFMTEVEGYQVRNKNATKLANLAA